MYWDVLLNAILDSKNVYYLAETLAEWEYSASLIYLKTLNTHSADHCQAGTDKKVTALYAYDYTKLLKALAEFDPDPIKHKILFLQKQLNRFYAKADKSIRKSIENLTVSDEVLFRKQDGIKLKEMIREHMQDALRQDEDSEDENLDSEEVSDSEEEDF